MPTTRRRAARAAARGADSSREPAKRESKSGSPSPKPKPAKSKGARKGRRHGNSSGSSRRGGKKVSRRVESDDEGSEAAADASRSPSASVSRSSASSRSRASSTDSKTAEKAAPDAGAGSPARKPRGRSSRSARAAAAASSRRRAAAPSTSSAAAADHPDSDDGGDGKEGDQGPGGWFFQGSSHKGAPATGAGGERRADGGDGDDAAQAGSSAGNSGDGAGESETPKDADAAGDASAADGAGESKDAGGDSKKAEAAGAPKKVYAEGSVGLKPSVYDELKAVLNDNGCAGPDGGHTRTLRMCYEFSKSGQEIVVNDVFYGWFMENMTHPLLDVCPTEDEIHLLEPDADDASGGSQRVLTVMFQPNPPAFARNYLPGFLRDPWARLTGSRRVEKIVFNDSSGTVVDDVDRILRSLYRQYKKTGKSVSDLERPFNNQQRGLYLRSYLHDEVMVLSKAFLLTCPKVLEKPPKGTPAWIVESTPFDKWMVNPVQVFWCGLLVAFLELWFVTLMSGYSVWWPWEFVYAVPRVLWRYVFEPSRCGLVLSFGRVVGTVLWVLFVRSLFIEAPRLDKASWLLSLYKRRAFQLHENAVGAFQTTRTTWHQAVSGTINKPLDWVHAHLGSVCGTVSCATWFYLWYTGSEFGVAVAGGVLAAAVVFYPTEKLAVDAAISRARKLVFPAKKKKKKSSSDKDKGDKKSTGKKDGEDGDDKDGKKKRPVLRRDQWIGEENELRRLRVRFSGPKHVSYFTISWIHDDTPELDLWMQTLRAACGEEAKSNAHPDVVLTSNGKNFAVSKPFLTDENTGTHTSPNDITEVIPAHSSRDFTVAGVWKNGKKASIYAMKASLAARLLAEYQGCSCGGAPIVLEPFVLVFLGTTLALIAGALELGRAKMPATSALWASLQWFAALKGVSHTLRFVTWATAPLTRRLAPLWSRMAPYRWSALWGACAALAWLLFEL